MPGTAIFDLDRTITKAPTWTWFLLHVNGRKPWFWGQFALIVLRMIAYKLKFVPRSSIKQAGLRSLAAFDHKALQAAGQEIVDGLMAQGLRPGAVAAIKAHQAQGDRLVLVSAAVDVVADPLARALGFDDVIATRLIWSDGATGPMIDGANCYGPEKLRRIALAQEQHPFPHPLYAYSDHVSDLDLLLQADHGIAVNPSSGLRHAAQTHGLTIVDFDSPDSLPDILEQTR